jgi:hypothetical protein
MISNSSDGGMPALRGAAYLRRIRLTTGQPELATLRREIARAYLKDPFTWRLVAVIKVRALRLQARN